MLSLDFDHTTLIISGLCTIAFGLILVAWRLPVLAQRMRQKVRESRIQRNIARSLKRQRLQPQSPEDIRLKARSRL